MYIWLGYKKEYKKLLNNTSIRIINIIIICIINIIKLINQKWY